MAVELSLHEEGRVVYQRYCGTLALTDIEEAARTVRQHVENSPVPVHTIVDIRHVTDVPASLRQINQFHLNGNQAGWMVVIGLHPAVRFLAGLLSGARGLHYRTAATLEDALCFLARHDAALGHLAQ